MMAEESIEAERGKDNHLGPEAAEWLAMFFTKQYKVLQNSSIFFPRV